MCASMCYLTLALRPPDEENRTRIRKDGSLRGLSMSTTWSWMLLVVAGLLEICWAIGLKYSQGFTRMLPSAFTIITLAGSMYLLAKASQGLPIGTAYGAWVGIGAFGTAVLGIFLFQEPATASRFFFLGLLLLSIIGLKFTS